MRSPFVLWLLPAAFLLLQIQTSDGVAVMAVDLGSAWLKIAIVKPGVPMEIVLNKESRRKTPLCVSFKDGERLFGESALSLAVKAPHVVVRYATWLLGKRFESPLVQLHRRRFPELNLTRNHVTGRPSINMPGGESFSPEEILAMILNHTRSLAQDYAGQPVSGAVVSVSPWLSQAERRSVSLASRIAGLPLLQLIGSNAATATNYAAFSRSKINATAQHVLFYDMGASGTSASLVSLQTVKVHGETQPQVLVKGVGYDRTLGGLEMDFRLRSLLAEKFVAGAKTGGNPPDLEGNPRAWSKLLREAERVKIVLSANAEHTAQVESLVGDRDLRVRVTRSDLEGRCDDLVPRVARPIEQALRHSGMTMAEIDQVIIVGGATRVPRIQQEILKAVGMEQLGRSVNADESVALGAVFRAAALSQAFRVKPLVAKDTNAHSVQVVFARESLGAEGEADTPRFHRRLLFQKSQPLPQRKVISFNRFSSDFNFTVSYTEVDEEETGFLGGVSLCEVRVSGVSSAFSQRSAPESEPRGVKAHLSIDPSGLLHLDRIEAVFEKEVEEVEEEESTLTKLGNTITSLFGGSSSDKNETETPNGEEGEEPKPEGVEPKAEGEEPKEDGAEPKEGAEPKDTGEEPKETPPSEVGVSARRRVKVSVPLEWAETRTDLPDPDDASVNASRARLQALTERDWLRHETEKAYNNMEALIFDTQDRLQQDVYQSVTTEEERAELGAALAAASDWLEEEGASASLKALRKRTSSLRVSLVPVSLRVSELSALPESLSALETIINSSIHLLRGARSLNEEDQIFTEVELGVLETAINTTIQWKNTSVAQQASLPATSPPVLLSRDVDSRASDLQRELFYLVNKAKIAASRPSGPPPPAQRKNATGKAAGKKGSDTAKGGSETGSETGTGSDGGSETAGTETGGETGTGSDGGAGSEHETGSETGGENETGSEAAGGVVGTGNGEEGAGSEAGSKAGSETAGGSETGAGSEAETGSETARKSGEGGGGGEAGGGRETQEAIAGAHQPEAPVSSPSPPPHTHNAEDL